MFLQLTGSRGIRLAVPKTAMFFICSAVIVVSGCAPGMNDRSLGGQAGTSARAQVKQSDPEVVVVEKSQPQARLASQLSEQQSEIAKLRNELSSSQARTDAAETAARDAQTSITALQNDLAQISTRVDTATAQSEKAFQISTEFLSNLVAAREEQRSLIERNLRTFDAMDERLKNVEGLVAEARREQEMDANAAQAMSAETDQRLQKADRELAQLREQLTVLNRQNQEVRAAIDSGAMMGMLRDLEATRRDTSMLRGAVEQLQREQEGARKRMQNYYLDLDARIQALQDQQAAARKQGASGTATGGDLPAQDLEMMSPADSQTQQPSMQGEPLPPLEIGPYENGPATPAGAAGSAIDESSAGKGTNAATTVQPPQVTEHGVISTDYQAGSAQTAPAEPAQ